MRVGILGGGQLGCMLAESVLKLGGEVLVYDADRDAPASRRYPFVSHSWTDADALRSFLSSVDVATYEFENVNAEALRTLAESERIRPSIHVLETCQHRVREKQFLRDHRLPHVPYVVAESKAELERAVGSQSPIGYPCVIKSALGGYDGHGQSRINTVDDVEPALQGAARGNGPWVVERIVDLVLEVSCIVSRGPRHEVAFPLFENTHQDHVLDVTVVPARLEDDVAVQLREVALACARGLEVEGLLTVEFFVARPDSRHDETTAVRAGNVCIYVNELAPRPHNSGHVTRNACSMSQFDALARSLLGVPVLPPTFVADAGFCMGNLLGDVWIAQGTDALDLSCWADHPSVVDVVLYGKRGAKPKRKMGHFVTRGRTPDEARYGAEAFRQALKGRLPKGE